jgi:hypothetical protein
MACMFAVHQLSYFMFIWSDKYIITMSASEVEHHMDNTLGFFDTVQLPSEFVGW